ncbi:MAG TPA: DMT family transporter [Steroidobacteraceae bacterium]|nr:DMT family transporter [Steroidobacteraceae bacterium]HJY39504.1 DMT family transporter [Steroidobacteraceae bacterium]
MGESLLIDPAVRAARTRAWLQLHFCVVLWGFTAIFGRLISLPALPLVWWRMTLVGVALLAVAKFWRGVRGLSLRQIAIYAGIGVLVALHWLTFYGSIKLSNASVGATCMALMSVLMAFIEPLIVRSKFDPRELLFGLAVIPGVLLVIGGTPSAMRLGIAVGVLSVLILCVFGALNKRYISRAEALTVTGIEMISGALFLTCVGALVLGSDAMFALPSQRDGLFLLALALGCTLLPFTLGLVAMRHLSAFSTALALNLEPVYAIVLAIVLLNEQRELAWPFYLGVAIILGVVLLHARMMAKQPAAA